MRLVNVIASSLCAAAQNGPQLLEAVLYSLLSYCLYVRGAGAIPLAQEMRSRTDLAKHLLGVLPWTASRKYVMNRSL